MRKLTYLLLPLVSISFLTNCGSKWTTISKEEALKERDYIVSHFEVPNFYNAKLKKQKITFGGRSAIFPGYVEAWNLDERYFRQNLGGSWDAKSSDLKLDYYVMDPKEENSYDKAIYHLESVQEIKNPLPPELHTDDHLDKGDFESEEEAITYLKDKVKAHLLRYLSELDILIYTIDLINELGKTDSRYSGSYKFQKQDEGSLKITVHETTPGPENAESIHKVKSVLTFKNNLPASIEDISSDNFVPVMNRFIIYDYQEQPHRPEDAHHGLWVPN